MSFSCLIPYYMHFSVEMHIIGMLPQKKNKFSLHPALQKLTLECNFHLYQQSHSHSDEDYLGLLRHREQLENVSFRRSIHFSSASCIINLSHDMECFQNPNSSTTAPKKIVVKRNPSWERQWRVIWPKNNVSTDDKKVLCLIPIRTSTFIHGHWLDRWMDEWVGS